MTRRRRAGASRAGAELFGTWAREYEYRSDRDRTVPVTWIAASTLLGAQPQRRRSRCSRQSARRRPRRQARSRRSGADPSRLRDLDYPLPPILVHRAEECPTFGVSSAPERYPVGTTHEYHHAISGDRNDDSGLALAATASDAATREEKRVADAADVLDQFLRIPESRSRCHCCRGPTRSRSFRTSSKSASASAPAAARACWSSGRTTIPGATRPSSP